MRLHDATLAAIDFESTGTVTSFPNEPWQVGLVTVHAGRIGADTCYESLIRIDPERPFNPYAPGRYDQLRPELETAPGTEAVFKALQPRLSGLLSAHNIATEKRLLRTMAPMHAFGPWLDTVKLARKAWPGFGSYALENLVVRLVLQPRIEEICPGRHPHDALYDAVASAAILERLCEGTWGKTPIEALAEL